MQQINGFAAELSGAKLWIRVAMAMLFCVGGMWLYTWSKSNTMYGDQHSTNTERDDCFVRMAKIST